MKNKCFWQGKKVVVTGHTGFKGSWLITQLNKVGANVIGISKEEDISCSLYNQIKGNNLVTNEFFLDIGLDGSTVKNIIKEVDPDVIFHFAAQPLVIKSYSDPVDTWQTNVIGTLNVLEGAKLLQKKCSIVVITTDKVYENKEWLFSYRENDRLGGKDPYSASKAAAELLVSSWRHSFTGDGLLKNPNLYIATARAGNVIGGGDWADNRIIPDMIRANTQGKILYVRNPSSIRPWQHVLEPVNGYMILAKNLYTEERIFCSEFNFGPNIDSSKTVRKLLEEACKSWNCKWIDISDNNELHEATLLGLSIEKSNKLLGWEPIWNFEEAIAKTINWYKDVHDGEDALTKMVSDIDDYQRLKHKNK